MHLKNKHGMLPIKCSSSNKKHFPQFLRGTNSVFLVPVTTYLATLALIFKTVLNELRKICQDTNMIFF